MTDKKPKLYPAVLGMGFNDLQWYQADGLKQRQDAEANVKRSPSLNPKCIKENRPKGVGYSSMGWLIPCCWTDPRHGDLKHTGLMDNPLFSALFTEELKVENVDKIEDIIYSEPWKEFGKALLNEPEKCPAECHKYCGSDLPNDGFVYKKHLDQKKHTKFFGTSSRYNVPGGGADETLLENNKEFKRYKQRKKDGSLPRHHYTDDEWKELNRRKKYHDWVTDENRPLGGSHQHKANFSSRKNVFSSVRGKKKRNFVYNSEREDDDFN